MILYYSATGNSKIVAQYLAKRLDDKILNIVDLDGNLLSNSHFDKIGIVFPVYGWNIPLLIQRFLKKTGKLLNTNYLYFVITCGDDVGMIDKQLSKLLHQSNSIPFDAIFSVTMPNTYVCLPGFDVDKKAVRQQKLHNLERKITSLSTHIKKRHNIILLTRGIMPRMKTYVLGKLFLKFLITDKPFQATDNCTLCGTCKNICPQKNISMDNKNIRWNHNCIGCLACYHHCPHKAIQFGKLTQKKGQYTLKKYSQEL